MSFEIVNSDVIVVREGLKRYPFFVAMGKNQLQFKKRFREKPDRDFSSGSRPNKKKPAYEKLFRMSGKNCGSRGQKVLQRWLQKFLQQQN